MINRRWFFNKHFLRLNSGSNEVCNMRNFTWIKPVSAQNFDQKLIKKEITSTDE